MPKYPISGGPISKRVPEGDNRERLVCNICDYIEYDNPKIVTGVVAAKNNRILLCKRDIEPQKGLWTLPAGFLELGESPEQGALREASEEANARISIDSLLAIYTITRLSMIQLIYRGELMDENHDLLNSIGVGHDTLEKLVEIAKENGALGAKLTGGGGGGNMVALAEDKTTQKKIHNAIQFYKILHCVPQSIVLHCIALRRQYNIIE